MKDNKRALLYMKKAWETLDSSNILGGKTSTGIRIANLLLDQNNIEEAMKWAERCLQLAIEANNKVYQTEALILIAAILLKENKLSLSKTKALSAMEIAENNNYPVLIRDASQLLSEIYGIEENWDKAFEMHQMYVKMKDSLFNMGTMSTAIQQRMKYAYDKRAHC